MAKLLRLSHKTSTPKVNHRRLAQAILRGSPMPGWPLPCEPPRGGLLGPLDSALAAQVLVELEQPAVSLAPLGEHRALFEQQARKKHKASSVLNLLRTAEVAGPCVGMVAAQLAAGLARLGDLPKLRADLAKIAGVELEPEPRSRSQSRSRSRSPTVPAGVVPFEDMKQLFMALGAPMSVPEAQQAELGYEARQLNNEAT